MIQMKQIDWASGKVPAGSVDGGCRIVESESDLVTIPMKEANIGMTVYCKKENAIHVLVKKGEELKFEKISGNYATNMEIAEMFVNVTGTRPNIHVDGAASLKLDNGEVAEIATDDDIRNMFI